MQQWVLRRHDTSTYRVKQQIEMTSDQFTRIAGVRETEM